MPRNTPWKPGTSGNPRGRPPIRSLDDAMRQKLRRHWAAFAESMIEVAIKAPEYALRIQAARIVLRHAKGATAPLPAKKTRAVALVVEEEERNGIDSDQNTETALGTGTGGA